MADLVQLGVQPVGNVISANPNNPATATTIGRLCKFTQVAAGGAGSAISTPIDPILNIDYVLRNDSGAVLSVFPSPGTTNGTTGQINGAAAGAAIAIQPGAMVVLTAVSNVQTTGAAWYSKAYGSAPGGYAIDPVIAVAAATTLTPAQSGASVAVTAQGGGGAAYAITLPLPAPGLKYKFAMANAGTQNVDIKTNGAATIMSGTIIGAATAVNTLASHNTLRNVGGTSVLGDWAEVWSDGTDWYAKAQSAAAGGWSSPS